MTSKGFSKILAIMIIVALNWAGLSAVGTTLASFSDTESSSENTFSAGILDIELLGASLTASIGKEARGEKTYASVVIPASESLPIQYTAYADVLSGEAALCDALTVEVKQNGVTIYDGPLSSFFAATTTDPGTWEFEFDLPPAALIAHGDVCNADAVFSSWRADAPIIEESGFSDEERISFSFTARMVVLNEIYARPKAGASAPKDREYIELFNAGNTPVETLGWQVSEMSGTLEKKYPIVASGAVSGEVEPYNGAGTIIEPGGFLVLQFGGTSSRLNDTGDTVVLYDAIGTALDSHAYGAIPEGKAIVRYPDGIGIWVDPEPTPGESNLVSEQEMTDSGLSEEDIILIQTLLAEQEKMMAALALSSDLLNEGIATDLEEENQKIENGETAIDEKNIDAEVPKKQDIGLSDGVSEMSPEGDVIVNSEGNEIILINETGEEIPAPEEPTEKEQTPEATVSGAPEGESIAITEPAVSPETLEEIVEEVVAESTALEVAIELPSGPEENILQNSPEEEPALVEESAPEVVQGEVTSE